MSQPAPSSDDAKFEAILASNLRSYVFTGADDPERLQAAKALAKRLNCPTNGTDDCQRCRAIDNDNSANVVVLQPVEGKTSISIEQVRGVVTSLAMRPYQAEQQRVVIIRPAEALLPAAQNALLKTLEEPGPNTWLLLLAQSSSWLLPTIVSRVGTYQVRWSRQDTLDTSQAEQLGMKLRQGSLFSRLVQTKEWSADSTVMAAAAKELHNQIVADVKAGNLTTDQGHAELQAVDEYRLAVAANVSPRAALERLLVALS